MPLDSGLWQAAVDTVFLKVHQDIEYLFVSNREFFHVPVQRNVWEEEFCVSQHLESRRWNVSEMQPLLWRAEVQRGSDERYVRASQASWEDKICNLDGHRHICFGHSTQWTEDQAPNFYDDFLG